MKAASRVMFTSLLALQAGLVGCVGYWKSTTQGQASFAATTPTSEQTFAPLAGTVLAGSHRSHATDSAIASLARDVKERPLQSRALFAADCGIQALLANDLVTAREMLSDAALIASSVSEASESEIAATSLHGSEAAKRFKGEPHERVVIFLYRGLLFLAEHDYENAHACFLNGALQDAMASEEQHRGNWLSIDLLLLYCKQRMGSPTADDFERSVRERYASELRDHPTLVPNSKTNVICVVGAGHGPEKRTRYLGDKTRVLTYQAVTSRVRAVRLSGCAASSELVLADDLAVQAETRGQRAMDAVLRRKKDTKEVIQGAGTAAATVGMVAANFVPFVNILGALLQEAALAKADKVKTASDTRQLYSTPGALYVGFAQRADSSPAIRIEVLGEGARVLSQQEHIIDAQTPDPMVVIGMLPY